MCVGMGTSMMGLEGQLYSKGHTHTFHLFTGSLNFQITRHTAVSFVQFDHLNPVPEHIGNNFKPFLTP